MFNLNKRKLTNGRFHEKIKLIALAAVAFLGITSSANAATAMLQVTIS